jgi:4-carboxymuconolactone decarboxylase
MIDQPRQVGGGRRTIGDVTPKLAALTDDVLFEDVWNRPELSARDRSLITVTALITGGSADQLPYHLGRALENGSPKPSCSKPSLTWRSMPAGPRP